MKKHLLFVCFSFLINTLISQENKQELVWFDNLIGQQNLSLNQGVIYSENYKAFNRHHPFLFWGEFQKGNLKYNNQMYYNVFLKYNIFNDNLILNSSKTENFSIILNKELISFFEIKNKTFYNINLAGFYEILYESEDITLVRKYFSKKKNIKEGFSTYATFTHEEKLLILKKNKFHIIKKKENFHKIFPNKKRLINDFFKNNKEIKKKNNTEFTVNLIKKLNNE